MALTTGNQLRAARGLVDISQEELAALAAVGINTVRNMESRGHRNLVSSFENVLKVQRVLEARGVTFLPEGTQGVGVRLRAPRRAHD